MAFYTFVVYESTPGYVMNIRLECKSNLIHFNYYYSIPSNSKTLEILIYSFLDVDLFINNFCAE